jgi:hypothetical protein
VGSQLLADFKLRQRHSLESREQLLVLRVCREKPVR